MNFETDVSLYKIYPFAFEIFDQVIFRVLVLVTETDLSFGAFNFPLLAPADKDEADTAITAHNKIDNSFFIITPPEN